MNHPGDDARVGIFWTINEVYDERYDNEQQWQPVHLGIPSHFYFSIRLNDGAE